MSGGVLVKDKRPLSKWQIFYMAYAKQNSISLKQAMSDAGPSYHAQK